MMLKMKAVVMLKMQIVKPNYGNTIALQLGDTPIGSRECKAGSGVMPGSFDTYGACGDGYNNSCDYVNGNLAWNRFESGTKAKTSCPEGCISQPTVSHGC